MDKRRFARGGAAILALSFGLISPVLAQAIPKGSTGTGKANETEQSVQSKIEQGGAGQSGTNVAPSTEPSGSSQPTTAQTGVGPRGTKVAPSTSPGQSGEQTR